MDASSIRRSAAQLGISEREVTGLVENCKRARDGAYCPYSNFRVGASILTRDGHYINGANVENASYPVGICAERTAFARAVADGYREFRALAVFADTSPPVSPCGMCRQFIREFCSLDFPTFLLGKDGQFTTMTLEQLLPLSFGPESLSSADQMKAAGSADTDKQERPLD